MITKIEECEGCCQRHTCDNNLEKCCYLVNWRCMIRKTRKYEKED